MAIDYQKLFDTTQLEATWESMENMDMANMEYIAYPRIKMDPAVPS